MNRVRESRRDEPLSSAIVSHAPATKGLAAPLPMMSRLASVQSPRGICHVGGELVVLNRNTGALSAFDLVNEQWRDLWSGPGVDYGPFVGPTYEESRKELIISAVGRDGWNRPPRRPGTVFAVSMSGQSRQIASQDQDEDRPGIAQALFGPSGTAALGNGRIAIAAFWSRLISIINTEDGSIEQVVADLAPIGGNPNGLAFHPHGYLLACDRTGGRLLAHSYDEIRKTWASSVLASGFQDPISVVIASPTDALVLSKKEAVIYRVELSLHVREPVGSVPLPIAAGPFPFAKACAVIDRVDALHVIIAIDREQPGNRADDGLYRISCGRSGACWQAMSEPVASSSGSSDR